MKPIVQRATRVFLEQRTLLLGLLLAVCVLATAASEALAEEKSTRFRVRLASNIDVAYVGGATLTAVEIAQYLGDDMWSPSRTVYFIGGGGGAGGEFGVGGPGQEWREFHTTRYHTLDDFDGTYGGIVAFPAISAGPVGLGGGMTLVFGLPSETIYVTIPTGSGLSITIVSVFAGSWNVSAPTETPPDRDRPPPCAFEDLSAGESEFCGVLQKFWSDGLTSHLVGVKVLNSDRGKVQIEGYISSRYGPCNEMVSEYGEKCDAANAKR